MRTSSRLGGQMSCAGHMSFGCQMWLPAINQQGFGQQAKKRFVDCCGLFSFSMKRKVSVVRRYDTVLRVLKHQPTKLRLWRAGPDPTLAWHTVQQMLSHPPRISCWFWPE